MNVLGNSLLLYVSFLCTYFTHRTEIGDLYSTVLNAYRPPICPDSEMKILYLYLDEKLPIMVEIMMVL